MKKIGFIVTIAILFCCQVLWAQSTITIMDGIVFYDGYAANVTNPPPPVGVIKHRNDLFARKLTSTELQSIGSSLKMRVVIKALCDNYDRIGGVNMALVPVGSSTYDPANVKRIELGRFITPFFNKNIQPDSVPYVFNIDNVAMLLKDISLTNNYDIWIELSVFGVPYAAQTQVSGCAGRTDVFLGKLEFITNTPAPTQNSNVLIPLFFNNDFNNYQAGATDTIGKTTKSITFNVPANLTDASFFLITSNHGANSGGEEYNRRFHYACFDNTLKLTYKPGRLTCEPFRQYNTQPNGIYGSGPKTPAQWQAFSNWCPGDVIDIRQINLGAVTAGDHTFLIRVPAAVFVGKQGNFPLSLYFHGRTEGTVSVINSVQDEENLFAIYPNPTQKEFSVELFAEQGEITLRDMLGRQVLVITATKGINNLTIEQEGIYIIDIKTKDKTVRKKLVVSH